MVEERSDKSTVAVDQSQVERHLPSGGSDGRTRIEERLLRLEAETRDGLGERGDREPIGGASDDQLRMGNNPRGSRRGLR